MHAEVRSFGHAAFTALTPAATCGALYTVVVRVVPTVGSVTCPCGGTPTTQGATLSRSFPREFRGQATLTSQVTVSCVERSGTSCPITCTVTVTIDITGNPGNDCARNQATVVGVPTTAC